jgi:hypothetical protein
MPDRWARRGRLIASLAAPLLATLTVSSISARAGGAATSGGDTSPVNLATPIKLADARQAAGDAVWAYRCLGAQWARYRARATGWFPFEHGGRPLLGAFSAISRKTLPI